MRVLLILYRVFIKDRFPVYSTISERRQIQFDCGVERKPSVHFQPFDISSAPYLDKRLTLFAIALLVPFILKCCGYILHLVWWINKI